MYRIIATASVLYWPSCNVYAKLVSKSSCPILQINTTLVLARAFFVRRPRGVLNFNSMILRIFGATTDKLSSLKPHFQVFVFALDKTCLQEPRDRKLRNKMPIGQTDTHHFYFPSKTVALVVI